MQKQQKDLQIFFERLEKNNPEISDLLSQFEDSALLFSSIPPLGKAVALPKTEAALFAQGKPFLPLTDWTLENLELSEAILAIIPGLKEILAKEETLDMPESALDNFAEELRKDSGLAARLVGLLLKQNEDELVDFAKKGKLDLDTLLYTLQNVFQQRASELAAQATKQLGESIEGWKQGYCPICGSHPNLSYIFGEGGARYLSCPVCREQWRYSRTSCPYCGTDEPNNITLFFVEDQKEQRAEACTHCKNYILSCDLRNHPDNVPFAHYIPFAMIPLDMLMSEKGFTPGGHA